MQISLSINWNLPRLTKMIWVLQSKIVETRVSKAGPEFKCPCWHCIYFSISAIGKGHMPNSSLTGVESPTTWTRERKFLICCITEYEYFSDDTKVKFLHCGLFEEFVLQDCEHILVYADMQNVYRCMQCLHNLNYYWDQRPI